jgi:hypothetical protein
MTAYFTIDSLRADPTIKYTGGSADAKTRPFVCYARGNDGRVYWTPLSTEKTQSARKAIPAYHMRNAVGRFVTDTVVVNDGAHTYSGSPIAFAAQSYTSERPSRAPRTEIDAQGIAIVLQAVAERGGQIP